MSGPLRLNLGSGDPSSMPWAGTDTPFRKKLRRILLCLLVGYLVIGFAYLIYGAIAESGLYAYIMSVEMETIGFAGQKSTFLVGIVVLLLPVLAVAIALEKFAIDFLEPIQAGVSGEQTTARFTRRRSTQFFTSVKGALVICGVPLAATVALLAVVLSQGSQELPIHTADLRNGDSTVPQDARYVNVIAFLAHNYLTAYREGLHLEESQTVNIYGPLTGAGWTPADPVRYFVHYSTYTSDRNAYAHLPDAFHENGSARFSGELKTSLPLWVEREWKSKGLKIAKAYHVIDWRELPYDTVPAPDRHGTVKAIGVIGVAITVITFMLWIILSKKSRAAS